MVYRSSDLWTNTALVLYNETSTIYYFDIVRYIQSNMQQYYKTAFKHYDPKKQFMTVLVKRKINIVYPKFPLVLLQQVSYIDRDLRMRQHY